MPRFEVLGKDGGSTTIVDAETMKILEYTDENDEINNAGFACVEFYDADKVACGMAVVGIGGVVRRLR